jgi:hypothetical protein
MNEHGPEATKIIPIAEYEALKAEVEWLRAAKVKAEANALAAMQETNEAKAENERLRQQWNDEVNARIDMQLDLADARTEIKRLSGSATQNQEVATLVRLIRHGIEALYEGDGDRHTLRATLANLDQLAARSPQDEDHDS